jgi:hypothetical protein
MAAAFTPPGSARLHGTPRTEPKPVLRGTHGNRDSADLPAATTHHAQPVPAISLPPHVNSSPPAEFTDTHRMSTAEEDIVLLFSLWCDAETRCRRLRWWLRSAGAIFISASFVVVFAAVDS